MSCGLMVVNAFLRTTKFDDLYQTLLESAKGAGMELSVAFKSHFSCEEIFPWIKDTRYVLLF